MRTWNVVALLLLVGVVVTPLAQAQSTDDLRQEVDQLKRDLQQVIQRNAEIARENADLRGQVADIAATDSSLEARVNALSETLAVAPSTTVNSHANPVTLEGEFRHRAGWVWDRDFDDDTDDDGTYHDGRFRVGMLFEFDRNVATYLSLQANGLFNNGDTPGGVGSSLSGFPDGESEAGFASFSSEQSIDIVTLYEGWIDLKNLFGRREATLRTGRQEIVLGNEFQFGNNDFFSGESFDGAHFMWMSENFDLHFIFAKLNTSTPFNTRNHPYAIGGDGYDDDELYSLYFTLKSIEDVDIDIYWIFFNGNNSTGFLASLGTLGNPLNAGGGNFFYHTVGARIAGGFDVAAGLDWNLEIAYQFGDIETGGGDFDVEGLAIEGEVGVTFNRNNRFRVFVRVLWAQGPDEDGDDTGYIPLFPERHAQAGTGGSTNYRARYGIMDIIPMANVLTAQAGFTFDPRQDWTVGATVLWAQLDEDFGGDEDLGIEVDVFAEYRYSDQTTISFGAAVFFADDATPLAFGGQAGSDDDLAIFIYTQIRVIF